MKSTALLLIVLCLLSFGSRASHVLGGDITWTCQGGQYVFQLTFYRDCNGADVNTAFENLRVWGHPTVTSITMNFIDRTDVSPYCTQVAGGPGPLDCGIGASGGNGIGAIEKVVYRSAPISLAGTPPAGGWVFTYENFSRSSSITNLVNPGSEGITLVAKMFAIPNDPGGSCVDNSPQFLQEPYFASCVGDPYEYNMNAVDPDLDSLSIFFGPALDDFPGGIWDPPNTPAMLQYEPGFSATSPTPGSSMNAANIPAQVDPSSGNLTFFSMNSGSFVVKVVAQSFRDGVLIAQVEREMQLIVVNCSGNNTKPDISGPFGGLFETTVNAGTLVNFTLNATDVEVLQDGSPQNNLLSASGLMFGTNYTDPNGGCTVAPCATLNATPIITMQQGVSTDFSWQTTCDHLMNPYGNEAAMIPYHFVFKVQDNYCQIPKVSYTTVTINVVNPGIVPAPPVECIQTDAAGNVTLNWTQVPDPLGNFNEYRIYTVQNGLIASIPNIATTSYVDPGVTQAYDYIIASASGCNGNLIKFQDTISNIYLDLTNPLNGTAELEWNDPITPALPGMGAYYHIMREYPAGTWTLQDSVPYGINFYVDTIDICEAYLSYQIILPNTPCDYTSNIQGDDFEDMIAPDIPVLYSVTIDTLTNEVTVTWNQNAQPDTYGYIIYIQDQNGAVIELDQIFGWDDTTYTYSPDITLGPLTYSVAAFDSCWTTSVPSTYQTSAKGELHTSVFLTPHLNICASTVDLTWTDYGGWDDLDHYVVYLKSTAQAWTIMGNTTANSFTVDVLEGETYNFAIEAISLSGDTVFSNATPLFIASPGQPTYHYLQVATVDGEEVILRHHIDGAVAIDYLSVQRLNGGVFEEIDQISAAGGTVTYVDSDVEVQEQSYVYRMQVYDSCGRPGAISNEAQTILLKMDNDDIQKLNYLYWSYYREFDGSILGYNVYRGYDGVFGGAPIATVSPTQLSFTDDVNNVVSDGRICYKVEAVESMNIYGFAERSFSNVACVVLPPLIYIPNAFTPGGVNPIFVPVLSDFDPADYDFTVFDRWGQPIFKTNQPGEGWDGTLPLTEKLAETGTYIYMVTLHDGDGIEIIKRGHVTLLK